MTREDIRLQLENNRAKMEEDLYFYGSCFVSIKLEKDGTVKELHFPDIDAIYFVPSIPKSVEKK